MLSNTPTAEQELESTLSNMTHINLIRKYLRVVATEFLKRGEEHDQSKFSDIEKSTFAFFTPRLKTMVYGSPEYQECLKEMAPALKHHYANNRHHPEHFEEGILGMSLFDLLEMFVDWTASTKRSQSGDIRVSLTKNKERFNMSPELVRIFENTITEWETLDIR